MTPDEMAPVRPRLEKFADQMLRRVLRRRDQLATGELYLRGLMLDGRRKSMDPMAERLGVDTQRLQQFMADSTWDYEPVRENLTHWALERIGPQAVVIDDVGFPKDGPNSPGVARMYSGTLGKTGNCQIGVSAHLVTDHASSAVNWRLFIPESWDPAKIEDPVQAETVHKRRDRCKIPQDVGHQEKWRLALNMIDQMYDEWGVGTDLPVVFDSGYGDCTAFRLGLEDRGLSYVAAVSDDLSAYPGDAVPELPEYSGKGRPPRPRYPGKPSNLRNLALAAGRANLRRVTWRQGTRKTSGNPGAKMRSRFMALPVLLANKDIPRNPDGSLPARLLLVEWPAGESEPTDYWITNLPAETPLRELVRLAKIRWRIEHDYRELNTGLGLKHFEGRSFFGWHRHVTLAALAQAFCTELRLDPKVPAPA
ncbi:SRSO17 transposase [Streptosporangium album]|uniref:SRSO17 transposase n=3 Tax=Streptosporangium album TaxID=47479 RepID=A0A7W7WB10_9ACTN|nr:IS701 family transposase [Streptosporangium album]MBB4937683.1 SRSO17 transposase [Streptosporangium album]MBB4938349.1 SRSO17 transposase [Streptosporangium album]MBB4940122.1 SRSO17 transposase [Streptosporangium album]MBB4940543.1 SRSO17 transposase [Streptosporangium album]MBB4940591.1 SRSO17 transposase [Streptosporangium album]